MACSLFLFVSAVHATEPTTNLTTNLTRLPSVALFYGEQAPWSSLAAFDWVVLEGQHHGDVSQRQLYAPRTRFLAYVSVGEVHSQHPLRERLPDAWRIGRNPLWNTDVIDQRPAAWPAWFVEHVARPQWQKGYRGFFLDTLDAYHRVARTPQERADHEAGLVRVVKALRAAFPEAKIILNRGFEILPQVAGEVDMVAAESLYQGWDPQTRRYREVPEADRRWLLERLEVVQRQHRLPVLAIDYVPPAAVEQARQTVRRIQQHGIIPWVTVPDLDILGRGTVEVLPRRVVVLHDAPVGQGGTELTYSPALRHVATPLYYLGLVPVFINPDEQALPRLKALGPLAGVVTSFAEQRTRPETATWLQEAIQQGLKVASVGWPGVGDTAALRETFGLELSALRQGAVAPVSWSRREGPIGFEGMPTPGRLDFLALKAPAGSSVWLQLQDGAQHRMDAVALTPWGGYALPGYSVMRLPIGNDEYRWVVNPIEFFRQALVLPVMPVAATTTESGRRLLLVHIDGDGFPSRSDLPGAPLASEVLLREVLMRYRVPTSMSFIEAEVAPHGLYPKLAPQMESLARRMTALPHVEVASHTYSHPFSWRQMEQHLFGKGYALDIPGYRFSAEREVAGSMRYINSRLTSSDKKVVLLQWSGDTNPSEAVLAEVARAGVLSINGGETTTTKTYNSMTRVAPLGVRKGEQFQVYAPNQNENIYTNLFTGPLYGHERVIETFELTEKPYRLKPVNVYFHTYSASRRASLEALHRVYRWALAQPLHPVKTSDWVRKALNYDDIVVARRDGGFVVRGLGALRELRLPQSAGVPQLDRSPGVAGYQRTGDQQYVHAASDEVVLVLGAQPDAPVALVEANARVETLERSPALTRLRLQAQVPLQLVLRHAESCSVQWGERLLKPTRRSADGLYHYASDHDGTETLTIGCP